MAASWSDVRDSKFSLLCIHTFQDFRMHKFVIPGDFQEIIRPVRASLIDAQIWEHPGQSGRVGNYRYIKFLWTKIYFLAKYLTQLRLLIQQPEKEKDLNENFKVITNWN